MAKLSKIFQSGKYKGLSYIEVWKKDPSYMYWMAENYDFFKPVIKNLEIRDYDIERNNKNKKVQTQIPTVEYIKEFFKIRPICGFDMSEHISDIYERCPINQRKEYFDSLLKRNFVWRDSLLT